MRLRLAVASLRWKVLFLPPSLPAHTITRGLIVLLGSLQTPSGSLLDPLHTSFQGISLPAGGWNQQDIYALKAPEVLGTPISADHFAPGRVSGEWAEHRNTCDCAVGFDI